MKKQIIKDIQLANIIAEELNYILRGANDVRLSELTITKVLPKGGKRHFIAYVAPLCSLEEAFTASQAKAALQSATPYLRYELTEMLRLKRAPFIKIVLDPPYWRQFDTL